MKNKTLDRIPVAQTFTDDELARILLREHTLRMNLAKRYSSTQSRKRAGWCQKANRIAMIRNVLFPNVTPLKFVGNGKPRFDLDVMKNTLKGEEEKRVENYPKWIDEKRLKREEAVYQLRGIRAVYNKFTVFYNEGMSGPQETLFPEMNCRKDQDDEKT